MYKGRDCTSLRNYGCLLFYCFENVFPLAIVYGCSCQGATSTSRDSEMPVIHDALFTFLKEEAIQECVELRSVVYNTILYFSLSLFNF